MAKGRARDLGKEAAWRRRLARHTDSGQTVRAWCRRHGLKEAAFHWWRRELSRRDAEQPFSARHGAKQPSSARRNAEAQATSFVPVHLIDEPARSGDGQIEIELSDGRRVRVMGTVDREMLAQVLDVLERRAC